MDDNVRLTIDEYRNKLYQLIRKNDSLYNQIKKDNFNTPNTTSASKSKSKSSLFPNQNNEDQIYQNNNKNSMYSSSYNNYDLKPNNEVDYHSDSNYSTPTTTPPPVVSQQQQNQPVSQSYISSSSNLSDSVMIPRSNLITYENQFNTNNNQKKRNIEYQYLNTSKNNQIINSNYSSGKTNI